MEKVKIELSPHHACTLKFFLRLFINKWTKRYKRMKTINEAVESYEKELLKNITPEQVDEAMNEAEINRILGYQPPVI